MKKIKNLLFYYAYTLFSNKEAIRAYQKSWKVAIGAFFISLLILLTPTAVAKILKEDLALVNQFGNLDEAFSEIYRYEVNGEPITCQIQEGFLDCGGNSYEFTAGSYQVYLNKKINLDDLNLGSTYTVNDNVIVLNEEEVYIRKVIRDSNQSILSSYKVEGSYSMISSFDINAIHDFSLTIDESQRDSYYLLQTAHLLNAIDRSTFLSTMSLWAIQYILSMLLLIVTSGILIHFGNKRGQRADEYGWSGSYKIATVLMIAVSFLSSVLGLIAMELTPIVLTFIYILRLLFIYLHQFTRYGQRYNIIRYKK